MESKGAKMEINGLTSFGEYNSKFIFNIKKFVVVCSWCLSDKDVDNDEGGSWQFATQDTFEND